MTHEVQGDSFSSMKTFQCPMRETERKSEPQGIGLIYVKGGFSGSSAGKKSACNAGSPGSIPGSGRSPGEGLGYPPQCSWDSLVAQMVKNPPTVWETWVGKIPWRRAWQPTPMFLPGKSPWTEEPGGLQSVGSQRVRHG